MKTEKFILKLTEASIDDIDIVGGKNASLGEMLQNLGGFGINIPDGFIITAAAYYHFISSNKLDEIIKQIIDETNIDDLEALMQCGASIRSLICSGEFPPVLESQIIEGYKKLSQQYNQNNVDVAVRSSATAEDLPDASFAGQQDTFLNISGAESLLVAVKNCFASLFTDRAISYRKAFGYDHFQIGLSVCVQKMVRSDLGVSGVAFSLDTESGFKDAVVINGSYGLGEMIVQGAINPDEYIVFKPLLKESFRAIIEKKLGTKHQKMIYGDTIQERVRVVETSSNDSTQFCLSDDQILQLAKWVVIIEDYYSALKGRWCPMDVEWAVDGNSGELFIVQARPETIHSRKTAGIVIEFKIDDEMRHEKVLLKGIAVGDKIASGRVHLLNGLEKQNIHEINFLPGDIMVTDMTDPDWEPVMKKAAAIITNKGGRTCHAAIVARELGVPAIVGCENATDILKTGQLITASCAEGEAGIIYNGLVFFKKIEQNLADLPEITTPVMMNVASPEMAFQYACYPNKGVGLAREEFIINNYIKVHPLALLKHTELNDAALTEHIAGITKGYASGEDFFIEKLSYGIAKIAAAFYPNKVIVRFSDFKTNEYFNMPGGKYFEPVEENPMIGWRGASRYYSTAYKQAFGMECKAIKKVREVMGLDNVVVMIPFCRTVDELLMVYNTMDEFGLKRGENKLEVYLMAEVPSNVILAAQFAQHIDGFSIGSNDLTQLVLGLDRDSSLVAGLYNERNEAVKMMISHLIRIAKKLNVKVGICGQGPSDFSDFAQFLVEEGIDSISVTPDSFMKTVKAIGQIEQEIKLKQITLPQQLIELQNLTANSLF
ncbi:phosphoenolpyruvate synthase [Mucilaginibacter sp. KACC 22773]|uniref:phosphoenolpyruvate synthase n=1 Tax=Mucilaginibacter sp. KACC 22773 TaxID=3025671 RepID=UPI0023673219|nr:phosphoenolpyruvate synthase [Mucilaginibacter sp. KACC 22773]WDF75632.1 phosphoenolpyruvate synthase [Mucilaginibacter sp. KACC 22773]